MIHEANCFASPAHRAGIVPRVFAACESIFQAKRFPGIVVHSRAKSIPCASRWLLTLSGNEKPLSKIEHQKFSASKEFPET